MKEWVTMHEAAKLLKVSTKTIQRRVKDGTYKSKKNGQTREILFRDLGIQGENDQSSSANMLDKDQAEFLKEVIRNQQKHIESQDERISEVNKLILGIQGQVTQLNQNLQLVTSGQENRKQQTENSEVQDRSVCHSRENGNPQNHDNVTPPDLPLKERGGNGPEDNTNVYSSNEVRSSQALPSNHSATDKLDKSAWKKLDHFEKYQNIYLIVTVILAIAVVGSIVWQSIQ